MCVCVCVCINVCIIKIHAPSSFMRSKINV